MTEERLDVAVVGYGGIGRSLARRLREAKHRVRVGLRVASTHITLARIDGFDVFPLAQLELGRVDLLVLAVPDRALGELAGVLAMQVVEARRDPSAAAASREGERAAPVAMHLAGSVGTEPLKPLAEAGFSLLALHPMQAFPEGAGPELWNRIALGVTASEAAMPLARRLAESFGSALFEVPEAERVRYHLASVIASNFLPLLLEMGARQLEGIAPDAAHARAALLPLVAGMLRGLSQADPGEAMTGPVVRGDLETVRAHLALLEPSDRQLYLGLTRALIDLAERTGRIEREQAQAWIEQLTGSNGHGPS